MRTLLATNYRGYTIADTGDGYAYRRHDWDMWSPPELTLGDCQRAIDAELASYSTVADPDPRDDIHDRTVER